MEEESTSSKDHHTSSPSPNDIVDDPDSEESNNSPDNEFNELNILEEDLLCIVCRYLYYCFRYLYFSNPQNAKFDGVLIVSLMFSSDK